MKNIPYCPLFPNILFSLSYNLIKIQYSPPQDNIHAIQSSSFQTNIKTSFYQRIFPAFPLDPSHQLERHLHICFYFKWFFFFCIGLLSSQVSGSPHPYGLSAVQIQHQSIQLSTDSSLFTVGFLAHLQIDSICYDLFIDKNRTVLNWKDYWLCFRCCSFWHAASLIPADLFLPFLSTISVCFNFPSSGNLFESKKILDCYCNILHWVSVWWHIYYLPRNH